MAIDFDAETVGAIVVGVGLLMAPLSYRQFLQKTGRSGHRKGDNGARL
ncbi:MAG: hypothetical protein VX494_02740 [Actinomycetota bacterium]|nr:hypothetical protein [Actinomycetota bacterium]